MKKLIVILVMFTGCSSAPKKILMKNCEAAGSSLYYCEEIPKKEIGK